MLFIGVRANVTFNGHAKEQSIFFLSHESVHCFLDAKETEISKFGKYAHKCMSFELKRI